MHPTSFKEGSTSDTTPAPRLHAKRRLINQEALPTDRALSVLTAQSTTVSPSDTLANQKVLFSSRMASSEPKSFAPKNPVQLDPPKDDPISVEDLAKCDGTSPHLASTQSLPGTNELMVQKGNSSTYPTYVAIKGTIFDVSGNSAYGPNGSYHGTSAAPAPPPLHP